MEHYATIKTDRWRKGYNLAILMLFLKLLQSVFSLLTIHQINIRYFTHQNNMKLSLSFAVVSQPLELFNQFKVSASFQSI